MRLNGIVIGVLLALLPTAVLAQEVRYRGICDASAAIALGPDHFVVAEDETETLVVYRRGDPNAVSKVPLCADLGGHKGSDDKCIYPPDREGQDDRQETDIEGAARIGNLIYWIMSHGLNSDSDPEEPRRRFFATEIVATGDTPTVKLVATPYKSLLDDLLAEEKFKALKLRKAAEKAPEDKDGFNIEGLAATPEGHLLIGFRNPIRGGKAIIIPLMNPEAVIRNGSRPAFDDAHLLKLDKRGIRSIERVGARYLIVAGPFDSDKDSKLGFALYSWSGKRGEDPTPIDVDLGKLHPEALFAVPGGKEVDILSDDGDERVDGKKCKKQKDLVKKSFRAMTLKLP